MVEESETPVLRTSVTERATGATYNKGCKIMRLVAEPDLDDTSWLRIGSKQYERAVGRVDGESSRRTPTCLLSEGGHQR